MATSSSCLNSDQGGAVVVRLAFNGRDHFENLAAATEAVIGGQGRSPDPPAANRAEDPGFERSLPHRTAGAQVVLRGASLVLSKRVFLTETISYIAQNIVLY